MQPIQNASDILLAVIDATPDAIFVKDLEGKYVLVNQAAARFVGRTPDRSSAGATSSSIRKRPRSASSRTTRPCWPSGEPMSFEGVATSHAGTQAYLVTKGVYRDKHGRILGIYGISHDITELRAAQDSLEQTRQALFRSQKMEAVGQLTGGIAHDFNNILMVILGNLELLRMRLPHVDDATTELIDETLRATRHGQDLTGDLLAFSRRRQLNPQPVAINALVENIVRLLTRTLGASVKITTAASRDAGVAMVDPAALEAAILNIALNARDAMPERRHADHSHVEGRDHPGAAHRRRPADRPLRDARDPGHRHRHAARRRAARVRAVLHDQDRRHRQRPRPEHGLWIRETVGRRGHDRE